MVNDKQVRSQNAEKVTRIKLRLLDQAVVLFNCALFKIGTSPRVANSFL